MAVYYLRPYKYLSYIILIAALYFITSFYVFFTAPLNIAQKDGLLIEISRGSSLKAITKHLTTQGVITHPYYFFLYAKLKGLDKKIKFGEYLILPNSTISTLFKDLIQGNVYKYKFTIIEGWKLSNLLEALSRAEKLKKTIDYTVLKPLDLASLEGMFYPDTYFYTKDTLDTELLKLASSKLNIILNTLWNNKLPNIAVTSQYEAVILASIIEKESGDAGELSKIAGVYTRRLQKGIKLQADPTVVYALGDKYKGKVYYKDLKLNSPYNTYMYKGLPPTPIAFPSFNALNAALNPATGDDLYFVAECNGKHAFAKDFTEHIQNIIKIKGTLCEKPI